MYNRSRKHSANIQPIIRKESMTGAFEAATIIKGYTNVTRTDSDPNLHQRCKAFDDTIPVRTKSQTGCSQIACC